MSRILKGSGFAGLSVQMLWGMYNTYAVMPSGPGLPAWVVGAHAHFGVLGILAVVLGFAVDRYDVRGRKRSVVTWGFVAGQWLLPATLLVAIGFEIGPLHTLEFVWGLLLFASMAIMAWTVVSTEP